MLQVLAVPGRRKKTEVRGVLKPYATLCNPMKLYETP